MWSKDEAHLRARKAEAAHLGASEAARRAKASSIATPMSVGEQPRCYGSCPTRCYDDLRFVNESELSYRFSWRQADEPTPFPITPGAHSACRACAKRTKRQALRDPPACYLSQPEIALSLTARTCWGWTGMTMWNGCFCEPARSAVRGTR